MASKAVEKRYEGIKALVNEFLPKENGYRVTTDKAVDVYPHIDHLRTLGRTERWQTACDRFSNMVTEGEQNGTMEWAIAQGSIFLGHAAE